MSRLADEGFDHPAEMIYSNQLVQRRWKQCLLPPRFTLNVGQ